MTDRKILSSAIKKAIKNGWDAGYQITFRTDGTCSATEEFVIFNHEFAKAFFGEGQQEIVGGYEFHLMGDIVLWEWHLKQMVLCENPIQYLTQFLTK